MPPSGFLFTPPRTVAPGRRGPRRGPPGGGGRAGGGGAGGGPPRPPRNRGPRQRLGLPVQPLAGDDPLDEAVAEGRRGVDGVAGEDHVHGDPRRGAGGGGGGGAAPRGAGARRPPRA